MSQIALDCFHIVPILEGENSEGMAQIMDPAFRFVCEWVNFLSLHLWEGNLGRWRPLLMATAAACIFSRTSFCVLPVKDFSICFPVSEQLPAAMIAILRWYRQIKGMREAWDRRKGHRF